MACILNCSMASAMSNCLFLDGLIKRLLRHPFLLLHRHRGRRSRVRRLRLAQVAFEQTSKILDQELSSAKSVGVIPTGLARGDTGP